MTVLAAWLLADVITGCVHWWQDHYLDGDCPMEFVNGVSRDNDLHHSDPMAMTKTSLWENINTSILPAWLLAAFFYHFNAPTMIWLAFIFAAFSNIIHRWGHLHYRANSLIVFMQCTGLFISGFHHNQHHFNSDGLIKKENTKEKYCPMTNWMNPILDGIKFFPALEFIFGIFGFKTTKARNK